MRAARLYGLIFAAVVLDAPAAVAQRGAHPVHESNIELCRQVWQGQPQKEKRCLRARGDLVEALERNPYVHQQEKIQRWCQREERDTGNEGIRRRLEDRCAEDLLQGATELSSSYNYLQAAIADAVMWDKPYQEGDARADLERFAWCDDKYLRDSESVDYYSVMQCVVAGNPKTYRGQGFGPRE